MIYKKEIALFFMCLCASFNTVWAQHVGTGSLYDWFYRPILPDSLTVDTLNHQEALQLLDSLNLQSDEIERKLKELPKVATDTIPAYAQQDSLALKDTLAVKSDTLTTAPKPVQHKKAVATRKKKKVKKVNPMYVYMDSIRTSYIRHLHLYGASLMADMHTWNDEDFSYQRYVRPNPDYWKLIVPPTYYTGVIHQAFGVDWKPDAPKAMTATDSIYQVTAPQTYQLADLRTSEKVDRWINSQLLNYYMKYPERVVGNEEFMKDIVLLNDEQLEVKKRKEKILSFLKPEPMVENVEESELLVLKPNFWTQEGNGYAQFTQQYISDNWYQGGESTVSLLSGCLLKARYDDHQRLEWENSLELKLGFVTAPSDTVHSYRTNADLFRLNSKLGVRAIKNWYYTLATEVKTQFFANYRNNSNRKNSDFLSPLQLTVNLGMDFKQKKPKYDISVLASPFAYTLVYINSNKIDNPGAFNVEEGKCSANMFGSKVTGNLTWKIIPSVTWNAILEYFTTYDKVIASWENTINFSLNRYLSAKLFLHGRFDDGVTLDEDNHSYFQFQQLLSIGLNYTW